METLQKKWIVAETAPDDFLRSIPEHPLLLQVLYNRGLRTEGEVETFLAGTDAVIENPYRLRDMSAAVEHILEAIEREEIICVYGDFDADGVSATALLVTALQSAGGRVGPYIPDRVDEGYGLNVDAIERIAQKAHLLVTVDCGIRSVQEVARAVELGMDVIVTDHHSVGPTLPPALAVINPRRHDCPSNYARLAGVGVAYRLAQAVLRAVAQKRGDVISEDDAEEIEQELLDYVAVGTIADMMPLSGENRSLVQRGLVQLNRSHRPGLMELMARCDLRAGTVDRAAVSFRLAPRINAAGRLSSATLAYRLLRTNDPVEAFTISTELESLNKERRALTEEAQALAQEQIDAQLAEDASLLVVASSSLQSGIVGLVAGKLTDRFYRPSVVIEQGEEESRGSARSIPEFDISGALDQVSSLLVRHGGHSRAAGFTVKSELIDELSAALTEIAARELPALDTLRPTLMIDADVPVDSINWAVQQQFDRLEPTGQDNPMPLLLSRGVRLREARAVGSGKHLRLILDSGVGTPVLDGIAFGFGEWATRVGEDELLDIAYHVETNEWQGRQRLQLNVQDIRRTVLQDDEQMDRDQEGHAEDFNGKVG